MIRQSGLLVLVALAACSGNNLPGDVACTSDASCPFEQCCVAGTCVDPGPAGACGSASIASSTLIIAEVVPAGVTVPFTARLNDAFGRPVVNAAAGVAVESSCAECDTLTLDAAVTDSSGAITGTFASTRAEAKTVYVTIGNSAGAGKTLQVVPGDAIKVGFVNVADMPVNASLSSIAVTRFDAFDNAGAAPNVTFPRALYSVFVTSNAIGLNLWQAAQPLPASGVSVLLDDDRASLGETYIPFVAHGITLSGKPTSSPPDANASFVSAPFSITSPHFTSSMGDPTASTNGQVAVTWSVDPPADARLLDSFADQASSDKADSGAVVAPTFIGHSAHVRVVEVAPRLNYDVEVAPAAQPGALTASSDIGTLVDHLDVLPGGDVLVIGRFYPDLRLSSTVVYHGVTAVALQTYVARMSPDFSQARWVAVAYAATSPSIVSTATYRDSALTGDDGFLVLTEYTGNAAAWEFTVGGARKRCVVDGANTKSAGGLARLNLVTGEVEWCASFRDTEKDNNVTASALAVTGTQRTAALLVRSTMGVYLGVRDNSPSANPIAITSNDQPLATLAPDAQRTGACASSGTAMLVSLVEAPALHVTGTPIKSQVYMKVDSMEPDASGANLILGATVCANGSIQLAAGNTVATVADDAMILSANVASGLMTPLWQTKCTGNEGPAQVRQLEDGAFAVMTPVGSGCELRSGASSSTQPQAGVVVGRAESGQTRYLSAALYLTSATTVSNRSLVTRGDRVMFSVYGLSDVAIANVPGAAMLGANVTFIGETDLHATVRWTTGVASTTISSGAPLVLLPSGRTLVATSGTSPMIAGPIDTTPLTTATGGGGLRPLLFTLEPHDFVVRDILR